MTALQIILGVAAWFAVAVAAGMLIARAIHLRDNPPDA